MWIRCGQSVCTWWTRPCIRPGWPPGSGQTGEVYLWDMTGGQLVHILPGGGLPVHGVTFSRDGRHLATVGGDGLLRLWAMDSWVCEQELYSVRPYAGMQIGGSVGLSDWEREILRRLGARE